MFWGHVVGVSRVGGVEWVPACRAEVREEKRKESNQWR